MSGTVILIPVYNDWDSLNFLLSEISLQMQAKQHYRFSFFIVNDGSTDLQRIKSFNTEVNVLHLQRNIGHQRALTIGLAYIQKNVPCSNVLIMDADGEDQPADAIALLEVLERTGTITFAHRSSKRDKIWVQFFYFIYKKLFSYLTGKKIAYGHFVALPKSALDKLVYYSEIWNNIPAAILKSNLPYLSIPTKKGKRYSGKSKMSFQTLILHGLGAISVFMDVIASRLLIFSVALIFVSLIGAGIILFIRYFTSLAIPGWSSTILSSILIVFLQSFLLSLFTVFLYLSSQSQRKFIPALHYNDYVNSFEKIKNE